MGNSISSLQGDLWKTNLLEPSAWKKYISYDVNHHKSHAHRQSYRIIWMVPGKSRFLYLIVINHQGGTKVFISGCPASQGENVGDMGHSHLHLLHRQLCLSLIPHLIFFSIFQCWHYSFTQVFCKVVERKTLERVLFGRQGCRRGSSHSAEVFDAWNTQCCSNMKIHCLHRHNCRREIGPWAMTSAKQKTSAVSYWFRHAKPYLSLDIRSISRFIERGGYRDWLFLRWFRHIIRHHDFQPCDVLILLQRVDPITYTLKMSKYVIYNSRGCQQRLPGEQRCQSIL